MFDESSILRILFLIGFRILLPAAFVSTTDLSDSDTAAYTLNTSLTDSSTVTYELTTNQFYTKNEGNTSTVLNATAAYRRSGHSRILLWRHGIEARFKTIKVNTSSASQNHTILIAGDHNIIGLSKFIRPYLNRNFRIHSFYVSQCSLDECTRRLNNLTKNWGPQDLIIIFGGSKKFSYDTINQHILGILPILRRTSIMQYQVPYLPQNRIDMKLIQSSNNHMAGIIKVLNKTNFIWKTYRPKGEDFLRSGGYLNRWGRENLALHMYVEICKHFGIYANPKMSTFKKRRIIYWPQYLQTSTENYVDQDLNLAKALKKAEIDE